MANISRRNLLIGSGLLAFNNDELLSANMHFHNNPIWHGFNLTNFLRLTNTSPFDESDFAIIADFGFNFVRIPLDYRVIINTANQELNLDAMFELDKCIKWASKYRLHICLNIHRAPGYCVNKPYESKNLWSDDSTQNSFFTLWKLLTIHYRDASTELLSFNLLNEPNDTVDAMTYTSLMQKTTELIHSYTPNRKILIDGLRWGQQPLNMPTVIQSTRGYLPVQLTHYKAEWIKNSKQWPTPTWPLTIDNKTIWDKKHLHNKLIEPWQAVDKNKIFVGEWGVCRNTPHEVSLAYMKDCLILWQEAGWGWALWNLSGNFGIFNSNRKDVQYTKFHDRLLDKKMLHLLQNFI